MNDTRTVKLTAHLCEAAEKQFGANFGSIEELLETLLRELLRDDALKMDEQEHKVIEERLKALGYV